VLEQGVTGDAPELLGQIASGTQALPSGHNDSCNKRHFLLLDACLLYRVLDVAETH
jgi:hypothetical protein